MKTLLGLLLLALTCAVLGEDIVNSKVLRSIDLTSQFARHTLQITAENKGSSATSTYLLAVQNATTLAFIKAETETGPLTVTEGEANTNGYTTYKIAVPIEAGKSASFKVQVTHIASLEPFPHQITQGERQFVRYYGNAYFFSPYPSANQRTTVKLASTAVEGHSSTPTPAKRSGETLTYGAYENIAPFSHALLWAHFENNAPFLTVTKMEKEYEVSHWGNLAVEQWLDVRHDGAVLKGQFSRFDFQRNPRATPNAVLEITEILPNGAADVYYRDDIGNISTSSFADSPKGLEFHLVPRFPLFGGWKNNWYTGYNLPLSGFLNTDGGSAYQLNIPFSVEIDNLYIEDYTVKVILPEGAKITKVNVPFAVDSHEGKHFTYLDTTGRPVLVLSKRNVVPEHNVYFQVEYQFSSLAKWFEPLLIAAAFFVLLSIVMVYVRFQLSIKPVEGAKSFQRRDDILISLRGVVARVEAELVRQNAIAEKSTETTFKWTERPLVLDELSKVSSQASPLTTGENFYLRLKEFSEAQATRFKYQGKLHALRLQGGSSKSKVEKSKSYQEKIEAANEIIQQFKEDWIVA